MGSGKGSGGEGRGEGKKGTLEEVGKWGWVQQVGWKRDGWSWGGGGGLETR